MSISRILVRQECRTGASRVATETPSCRSTTKQLQHKVKGIQMIRTVFLLMIGVAVRSLAQTDQELVAISQSILNSITEGDTTVLKKYLLENCVFVTEEGDSHTKGEMVSSIRPLPKGFSGSLTLSEPRVAVYGNTGAVHYIAKEYEKIFDQEIHTAYRICETYVRTEAGWRILSSQVFEIPQHPAQVAVDSSVLRRYAGVYALGDAMLYEVTMEGGKLFGQRNGRAREELLAESENTFFTAADTRGVKIFTVPSLNMIARRNGKDVVWKRSARKF